MSEAIRGLGAGQGWDPLSGYARALLDAERAGCPEQLTVIVVVDGRRDVSAEAAATLVEMATTAAERGIATSAVVLGDTQGSLRETFALAGGGSHVTPESHHEGCLAVAEMIAGPRRKSARAASVVVRPVPQVRRISVHSELTCTSLPDGLIAELGDMMPGQHRDLILRLHIPDLPVETRTTVAEIEMTYLATEALSITSHTMDVVARPRTTDIGRPPDEAAHGRIFEALMEQVEDMIERDVRPDLEAELARALEAGPWSTEHGDPPAPDPELAGRVRGFLFELGAWTWTPTDDEPAG